MSQLPPPRPSVAVYRRRRLFVALVALTLVAVVVIVWGALSGGGDEAVPSASPSPSSFSSVSASAAASVEASEPAVLSGCKSDQLRVTAATDKSTYGQDENPVFSLKVENVSERDCILDAGTDQMSFVVTSGDTQIWSLKDCLVNAEPLQVTLLAGAFRTAEYTWEREPSSPGECKANKDKRVTAYGAYWLNVALGDVKSAEGAQFIFE